MSQRRPSGRNRWNKCARSQESKKLQRQDSAPAIWSPGVTFQTPTSSLSISLVSCRERAKVMMALGVSEPPPRLSQEMRFPCSSPGGLEGQMSPLFHRQPFKYSEQHCLGLLQLPKGHPQPSWLQTIDFISQQIVPRAAAGATPAPAPGWGSGWVEDHPSQMASVTSLTVGASRWLRCLRGQLGLSWHSAPGSKSGCCQTS